MKIARRLPPILLLLVPSFPAQSTPEDELYFEIEQLGWDLTERFEVPGVAVCRIHEGEIAWILGCGYADAESEEPVTGDTVFNIGSISKTVAAWGVLRLVEAGKVDLDAPVEKYLTRWKLPPSDEFDSQGVTLRRLLSHTAGLSLHGHPGFEPGEELPTVEASLSGATNGAGDVHLVYEPGTAWKYSGGGYTITQLLVEELTGRTFAEYMRAEVLLPLGMKSSDYRWTDAVDALAATPYDRNGKPVGGPRFAAQAAASLQTTAHELALFGIAGMPEFRKDGAPQLLKPETIAEMQSPVKLRDGTVQGYGLGYSVSDHGDRRVVGHGGANLGWMAQLSLIPAQGEGLVVLTNGSNGQRVIRAVEQAWREELGLQ